MNIYRALLRRYRPEAFEIARRALLAGSASIFAAAAARALAIESEIVNLASEKPPEGRGTSAAEPERAEAGPFGGTIAHGFLTLSLLVPLCLPFIPEPKNRDLVVNYGFDRVRFVAPVRVGKRIRRYGLWSAARRLTMAVFKRLAQRRAEAPSAPEG